MKMINIVIQKAKLLAKDERGASLLEYSILIGLITAGVVGTISSIGTDVASKWTALQTALGIQ